MIEIKHNKYQIKFEKIENEISDFSFSNIFYNKRTIEFNQKLKVKISINLNELEYSAIILVGNITDSDWFLNSEKFILFEESLIVYFDGNIFSFSLPKLELLWNIDYLWYVFGVYNYKEDIIVYDELSILRINKNGEIKWEYQGIDHFVSYEGNESFKMKENHIELLDSYENIYKIDYDGNALNDSNPKYF